MMRKYVNMYNTTWVEEEDGWTSNAFYNVKGSLLKMRQMINVRRALMEIINTT